MFKTFESYISESKFEKGDIVKLKPEFAEKDELDLEFEIVTIGNFIGIRQKDSKMKLAPIEEVPDKMIFKV